MTQFFSQLNKLDLDQKSILSPDYYFYAGFASPTYINTSKGLSLIFETFEMLFKMAKATIIADTQMEKVFQAILINSKIRVERELNRLLCTDPLEDIVQPEVYPKNSVELFGKVKTLLVHYENNPPQILEPLDLAFWGFLSSYAPDLYSDIFEKILSLRKKESSGAINKDQKLSMYELLYSIIVTNIQEYFENLDEKHSLALKSPSTSADSDEQNIVELFSEQESDIQAKQEEKIEASECRICFEVLETQVKLEICRHSFHIICLEEYVKAQMNENKFPILCPEEHCKAELTNSDLGRILKAEDLQNFYRLSVTHLLNKNTNVVFHCPTPNCAFKLFYAEPSQKEVGCPLCLNTFCLTCKEHCHPNAPCEVNQFIKVARDLGLKACPTCRHWVERTEGCNHMTCNCGYEFCYQCGRIYDSVQADYGGYPCAEGYCQEDEYYNDFEKLLSLQEGE